MWYPNLNLSLVTNIYTTIKDKYNNIDKISILMSITLAWSKICRFSTKVSECVVKNLFKLPDRYLSCLATNVCTNSSNKYITITTATDGNNDIRNKLSIIMHLYWEIGGSNHACETNGFDFARITKLLNVKQLYCEYVLSNGLLPDLDELRDVFYQKIVRKADGECYALRRGSIIETRLWLRNVDFEGDHQLATVAENDYADLIDFINNTQPEEKKDEITEMLDNPSHIMDSSLPPTLNDAEKDKSQVLITYDMDINNDIIVESITSPRMSTRNIE
jgi:hypothetical protein